MIEILSENLIYNVNEIRKVLRKNTKLYAVVKANAYGLGVENIVPIINNLVDGYVVFSISEGINLRKFTNLNILVLGPYSITNLEVISQNNLEILIHDKKDSLILENSSFNFKAHIELDSGLGRAGVLLEELEELISKTKTTNKINVIGLVSHLADAKNLSHTNLQVANFDKACELLENFNYKNILKSFSASSGLNNINLNYNAVRVGASLVGINMNEVLNIKPVIRWTSYVSQIRVLPQDFYVGYNLTYKTQEITKTVVIPVGYADGYDRRLSNSGEVLIDSSRCKVLGVVMMNNIVVDVTHIENIAVGDEVVLLGQQGNEEITLNEIATKCNTIEYEIFCNIK